MFHIYIYIYIYICNCSPIERYRHTHYEADITRQKLIHVHQYISTVYKFKQVYRILNNWCICINLSCGLCKRY